MNRKNSQKYYSYTPAEFAEHKKPPLFELMKTFTSTAKNYLQFRLPTNSVYQHIFTLLGPGINYHTHAVYDFLPYNFIGV